MNARRRVRTIDGFVPDSPENHFSGGRLQNAGDGDLGIFTDQFAGIVHDDHRSVIEIGDALIVFLAFL